MIAEVLERDAEFLDSRHVLDRQGDVLVHGRLFAANVILGQCLVTDELGDLAHASQKNLHSLLFSGLPPVLQEVFHAAVEAFAEEVLKLHIDAETLVLVGHQANVDDRHHILSLRHVGRPHHDYEILLGLWTQFQCDALRQLLAHRVFNVPRLVLDLTVNGPI